MNAEYFKTLFDYNTWAHRRVWDCVMPLTDSQFKQEFGFSWRSVHGELVHNMWAEWLYFQRITGESPTVRYAPQDFPTRDAIETRWQDIEADWQRFIHALRDEHLVKPIPYHDMGGSPHTTLLWQLLAHLINHSTTHRVTTLAMVDLLGGKTVDQDLIYYLREKP